MTFGTSLGRGIGRTGATLVHAGAVALSATGKFGTDVAAGTTQAYDEHSVRLAQLRMAAPPRSIKVSYAPRKAKATA